jgi:hypothetical protein
MDYHIDKTIVGQDTAGRKTKQNNNTEKVKGKSNIENL